MNKDVRSYKMWAVGTHLCMILAGSFATLGFIAADLSKNSGLIGMAFAMSLIMVLLGNTAHHKMINYAMIIMQGEFSEE